MQDYSLGSYHDFGAKGAGALSFAYKWLTATFLAVWLLCPIPIRTLLVLMLLDFVAGGVAAYKTRDLKVRPGIIDLQIKALTLFLLLGCRYMSVMTASSIDYGAVLAVAFGVHYFSSFVSYCSIVGVAIPPALIEFLNRVRRVTGWNDEPKAPPVPEPKRHRAPRK